jgi:hypothetical protein
MSARAFADAARFGAAHRLAVDAYSMQHPNEYGRSGKSYAAHLTRLCCAMEHGGEASVYAAIPRWLSGAAPPPKPPVLERRGALTIAQVRGADGPEENERRVRAWAESVWAAYASQHETARAWVRSALGA